MLFDRQHALMADAVAMDGITERMRGVRRTSNIVDKELSQRI